MAKGEQVLIPRPATQSDLAFILDSFTNEFARSVYADALARSQVRQLMVTILSKADWNCTILSDQDIQDEILAYAVWRDPHHVAWIHTKGRYRRRGIARQLLTAIGAVPGAIKATFIPSPTFGRSVRGHGWNLLHRPWQGLV